MTTKKIKVLQVCAVGFTVEKMLLPLIDEMSKAFDVTTVCSHDSISEGLKRKGYKIKNIDIDRRISPFRNLKTVIKLYKYIKSEKFDIVHLHTPVAGILGRIAAKMAGVPVVIYTAHGFYFHDNMPFFKKNLFVLFEKIGGYLSDYIFTQSTEDYHTAIQKRITDKSRIIVIGNGVDIERFKINRVGSADELKQIRDELKIDESDVVVGIIGRVVREKGYLEWIQAAKTINEKYTNVKFLAIGDTLESDRDGIKSELDKFIEQNNLKDRIIFTGARSDIPKLLAIIDIFTLPSYREGMPRSLIEAMSMEKPAVATDIRGCREEVENGITGFLVPVNDYITLADKIIYLIENPDIRVKMGVYARKKVECEFDERIVIKRQLDTIEKLVNQKIHLNNSISGG